MYVIKCKYGKDKGKYVSLNDDETYVADINRAKRILCLEEAEADIADAGAEDFEEAVEVDCIKKMVEVTVLEEI